MFSLNLLTASACSKKTNVLSPCQLSRSQQSRTQRARDAPWLYGISVPNTDPLVERGCMRGVRAANRSRGTRTSPFPLAVSAGGFEAGNMAELEVTRHHANGGSSVRCGCSAGQGSTNAEGASFALQAPMCRYSAENSTEQHVSLQILGSSRVRRPRAFGLIGQRSGTCRPVQRFRRISGAAHEAL